MPGLLPAAEPQPVQPYPTARTKERARVFKVGMMLPWGQPADHAFFDQVVANWRDHQAKGDANFPRPPAYLIPAASVGIGHHDDQSIARMYADRSDLPAVGWPEDLRREGDYLTAHVDGVPVKLAEAINGGAYANWSPEFYRDYAGHGPTLRRLALLGADIPAQPDQGPMPQFVYNPADADRPNPAAFSEALVACARRHPRGFTASIGGYGLVTFSEAPIMTANQIAFAQALKAAGLNTDGLTPEGIDGILAGLATANEPPKPVATAPPTPAVAQEPAPATPATPAVAQEPKAAVVPEIATDGNALATFRELLKIAVDPLRAEVTGLRAELGKATAKLDTADQAAARAGLATFCETHKDRIYPSEMDPAVGPTLIDLALALPDATLATFAEGKVSQRAAFLAAVARRPPIAKFAERIPAPLNHGADRVNSLLAHTDLGRAALKTRQAAAVPEPRK